MYIKTNSKMEQHSHLNQSASSSIQSKVGSAHNIESLAHEAVKSIPNATEFLNSYFSSGEPPEHFRLPRPVLKDQVRHLPFGNVY